MPPDDEEARLTRQWLEKAEHDLLAAERLAQATPLPDVVAFHCQQAAEKALKAYLTWHERPFRRVHDLEELVHECAQVDAGFVGLLPAGRRLSPYAVDPRYPGEDSEPTIAEMQEAHQLARQILEFVVHRLPQAARP
jgi:HEPN domain-containing protein